MTAKTTTDTPLPCPVPITLPARLSNIRDDELVKLGIRPARHPDIDAEEPSVTCYLFPAGWTLEPTDNSDWQRLLDDHGNHRAAVFCDPDQGYVMFRRAISVSQMTTRTEGGVVPAKYGIINRAGALIYETTSIPYTGNGLAAEAAVKRLLDEHLAEHYPDWNRSILDYWD